MPKLAIGERAGAILDADNEEARLLGYGVYEGDFVPTEAVGFFADMAKEMGRTNPRIRLDSGQVVYGCECWWGSEAGIKAAVGSRRVKEVNIDAIRAEVLAKAADVAKVTIEEDDGDVD